MDKLLGDHDDMIRNVRHFPKTTVVHILATRDVAREANIDLLTWAGTVRTRRV